MAFRCEFLVGNDGPNAALQQIRKWGTPKQLSEIDKSTKPATRYMIPKMMYEFSLNLINKQWNIAEIQEKNVRLCILDSIQFEAFDQDEIDFGFPAESQFDILFQWKSLFTDK